MYEHFEHTADLGLRVRAPDLNMLFAEAAEALSAAIVEDVTAIEPREPLAVRISGTDRAYLLFDWLRELLYRFDAERRLFRRFEVTVREDGLEGTAWGEPYDAERHPLSHEVKAITYHGLMAEQIGGEWLAEVIVDI
jgi:SHS2 domain-containing protein